MKKDRFVLSEDESDSLVLEVPAEPIVVEPEIIPEVIPEEPIVEPEVPEEVVTNVYSDMLQDLLRKQWDVINAADSIIATMTSEESGINKEDAVAILKKLVDDTTISIGMVTKALGVVDPSQEDLMNQGVAKAEEVIGGEEPVDATVEDEEIVEENLKEDIHDEFNQVNFSSREYYNRYWEEEALYQLEYILDNLDDYEDDDVEKEIENLMSDDIISICETAADAVRNSDYIWEQIGECIRDSIIDSLAAIQKERENTPLVDLNNTDNTEGE